MSGENKRFAVTIGHELGSGGAQVGRLLAKKLGVPFVDRQILHETAQALVVPEEELATREERRDSFWQTFSRMELLSSPEAASACGYYPSDRELFEMESRYIVRIAGESSAVILGRGGRFLLRDHPRHFSVFVHARPEDRAARIRELYRLEEKEARRIMEKNDRERRSYAETFTHENWIDARGYDLCVNTSTVPPEEAVELICAALVFRFGKDVLPAPERKP